MKNIKVVFMGTPDFAVPILEMLIETTNVVLVVTQPDKEVGRKKELRKSPIKVLAEQHNIPIFQPVKIRQDYEIIKNVSPDLIVTCAYGQIVPQGLLDIPPLGAINVHASLLPKYRGSAPIQWALINGEERTGITLMYMDAGMDTGDMIAKKEYIIQENDNVGTLHDKLSVLGRELLRDYLPKIITKEVNREKQNEDLVTLAPMIKRDDEHLDLSDEGNNIINKIRALNPWPLANVIIDNQEVKVVEATFLSKEIKEVGVILEVTKNTLGISVKDGVLYLQKIKPFGKKIMDISSYLNGIKKEDLLGKKVI